MSLDFFRGVTIAAMILVNNSGDETSTYPPLLHAQWNGWTLTDLVFPFFLFIVGTAMAFSLRSRMQRGESRVGLLQHALWRGLLLFAMGVFLNGFPNGYHFASWRVYGVLQRIAVCYVVCALLELWGDWKVQAAVVFVCLAGYWALMRYMPVPGFGVPGQDIPLLDPDRNIAAWLDRKLLLGHLYEGTRDPEGVISTIPAVASCLMGLLTGKWLRSKRTVSFKLSGMLAFGIAAIALGEFFDHWFPINKKLWTSSYVLLTAGLAIIALAFCYWLLDVKKWRWGVVPWIVFGMNSIVAYVLSEILIAPLYIVSVRSGSERISLQEYFYYHFLLSVASPPNASLIYALAYMFACWILLFVLYRKRIFLKL